MDIFIMIVSPKQKKLCIQFLLKSYVPYKKRVVELGTDSDKGKIGCQNDDLYTITIRPQTNNI